MLWKALKQRHKKKVLKLYHSMAERERLAQLNSYIVSIMQKLFVQIHFMQVSFL